MVGARLKLDKGDTVSQLYPPHLELCSLGKGGWGNCEVGRRRWHSLSVLSAKSGWSNFEAGGSGTQHQFFIGEAWNCVVVGRGTRYCYGELDQWFSISVCLYAHRDVYTRIPHMNLITRNENNPLGLTPHCFVPTCNDITKLLWNKDSQIVDVRITHISGHGVPKVTARCFSDHVFSQPTSPHRPMYNNTWPWTIHVNQSLWIFVLSNTSTGIPL